MLKNVKMPTIAYILIYMNMINFMFSSVEHEKNKTSEPYLGPCCFISNNPFFFLKKIWISGILTVYILIVHMKTLISQMLSFH